MAHIVSVKDIGNQVKILGDAYESGYYDATDLSTGKYCMVSMLAYPGLTIGDVVNV